MKTTTTMATPTPPWYSRRPLSNQEKASNTLLNVGHNIVYNNKTQRSRRRRDAGRRRLSSLQWPNLNGSRRNRTNVSGTGIGTAVTGTELPDFTASVRKQNNYVISEGCSIYVFNVETPKERVQKSKFKDGFW